MTPQELQLQRQREAEQIAASLGLSEADLQALDILASQAEFKIQDVPPSPLMEAIMGGGWSDAYGPVTGDPYGTLLPMGTGGLTGPQSLIEAAQSADKATGGFFDLIKGPEIIKTDEQGNIIFNKDFLKDILGSVGGIFGGTTSGLPTVTTPTITTPSLPQITIPTDVVPVKDVVDASGNVIGDINIDFDFDPTAGAFPVKDVVDDAGKVIGDINTDFDFDIPEIGVDPILPAEEAGEPSKQDPNIPPEDGGFKFPDIWWPSIFGEKDDGTPADPNLPTSDEEGDFDPTAGGFPVKDVVDPEGNVTGDINAPVDEESGFDFPDIIGLPGTGDDDMPTTTTADSWLDKLGGIFTDALGSAGSAAAANIGNIGGAAINIYGQREAAEAAERQAKMGIDWAKELTALTRGDLDPFRQVGVDAIQEGDVLGKAMRELIPPSGDLREGVWDLDPDISVTGQGPSPDVWGGYEGLTEMLRDPQFQDLRDIEAKTGWEQFNEQNLIQKGGSEYEQLLQDAMTSSENRFAARGKFGTQEAADSAMKSMLRSMGEIEGINTSRLQQEMSRRGLDYNISSGERGQLFGEDLATNEFMKSLGLETRQQEVGEQLSQAQTQFAQQADRREMLWKEIFSEEQTEFENILRAREQEFGQGVTEQQIDFQNLLAGDQQEFNKLMQLVNTGGSAAARTGSIAAGMAPSIMGQYESIGDVLGTGKQEQYGILSKLLGDIFSGPGGA